MSSIHLKKKKRKKNGLDKIKDFKATNMYSFILSVILSALVLLISTLENNPTYCMGWY